jgi:hypothetical protein
MREYADHDLGDHEADDQAQRSEQGACVGSVM